MAERQSPRKFDPFLRTTILARSSHGFDLYHRALRVSWPRFLVLFVLVFLLLNALFAGLYMLGDHAISGAAEGRFVDHFFFSVQTLATIGYGGMVPQTLYGHTLVTVEAMVGLLGVGMFAALSFARLSLPRARVVFSKVAVIEKFNGVPTLMFRMANERTSLIIGARAQVSVLLPETTAEGMTMRRFHDLHLERSENPMLALTWLVMHPVTPTSPLAFLLAPDGITKDFAVLINITGVDEIACQLVHSMHAYLPDDLRIGHRFTDIISDNGAGGRVVDLKLLDHTVAHA